MQEDKNHPTGCKGPWEKEKDRCGTSDQASEAVPCITLLAVELVRGTISTSVELTEFIETSCIS